MKKMLKIALVAASLGAMGQAALAAESFEGVTGSKAGLFDPINNKLADGFSGLDWSNAFLVDTTYVQSISGNTTAIGDGTWGVVNGSSKTLTISSAQDFNFFGATFGKLIGSGATVKISAYDDGALKYTDTFSVGSVASFHAENWLDVDRIDISASNGSLKTTVVIDQMSVAAVPEPESYAMFIAGLGLIGALARRRAKRS